MKVIVFAVHFTLEIFIEIYFNTYYVCIVSQEQQWKQFDDMILNFVMFFILL